MCGKTDILRDKEFDSLVHASAEPAQTSDSYKPTHGGYPEPRTIGEALSKAADIAVDGAAQLARAELVNKVRAAGIDPPLDIKKQIINGIIAPFYRGQGRVDHVGLLAQLQTNKGSPLTQAELRVWGGVVGIYCADRLVAEIQALPESEQQVQTAKRNNGDDAGDGTTHTVLHCAL